VVIVVVIRYLKGACAKSGKARATLSAGASRSIVDKCRVGASERDTNYFGWLKQDRQRTSLVRSGSGIAEPIESVSRWGRFGGRRPATQRALGPPCMPPIRLLYTEPYG
jgi:hypothetical protein